MKGLMVYQNKKTSDGTDTCGHGGHAKSCKGLDHKDLWSFTIPRGRLQRQRPHKTQMPAFMLFCLFTLDHTRTEGSKWSTHEQPFCCDGGGAAQSNQRKSKSRNDCGLRPDGRCDIVHAANHDPENQKRPTKISRNRVRRLHS